VEMRKEEVAGGWWKKKLKDGNAERILIIA
jgi:hypothetical protein